MPHLPSQKTDDEIGHERCDSVVQIRSRNGRRFNSEKDNVACSRKSV